MDWKITLNKWATLTLLSAAAGAVAFMMGNLEGMGCPGWALPLAQAVLTGIAAAIANAIKHWNDEKGAPTV